MMPARHSATMITRRTMVPVVLSAVLLVSGCHVWWHGEEEEARRWWYYCDEIGCYRCTAAGCDFPDDGVCTDRGCSPDATDCGADGADGSCRTPTPTRCTVSAECLAGYICRAGTCIPGQPGPCDEHAGCGDGACCVGGECRDTGLCQDSSDCAGYGSGYVCDERGSCVPGPVTQPPSCDSASRCSDGPCVDGQCGTCTGDCGGAQTCLFDAHCGEGRACLDGQCTNRCDAPEQCGSGQTCSGGICVAGPATCNSNAECGGAEFCVNNRCYDACLGGSCVNPADRCSAEITVGQQILRICQPDPRARLECTLTADCTDDEVCVNGVCRTSCLKAVDCAGCDDGPVCGPGGYCMTDAEANPQCQRSADCADGKACLGGQCIAL